MDTSEVARLLKAYGDGDRQALDGLVPTLYPELKRVARAHLRREARRPVDTTALVHEAYMRLAEAEGLSIESRAHFLSIAARVMRRVLIDMARRRKGAKRGGGVPRVTLRSEALKMSADVRADDLLVLEDALERLAELSPRQVRVVECRAFAGMTVPETAEALGISPATVKRDWSLARAWLNRELRG